MIIRAISPPLLIFFHNTVDTMPATRRKNATRAPPAPLVSASLSSMILTKPTAHDWNEMIKNIAIDRIPETNFHIFIIDKF